MKKSKKIVKFIVPVLMFSALLSGCAMNHHDAQYNVAGVAPGTLKQQQALTKKLALMQAQVAHAQSQLAKAKGQLSVVGNNLLIQKLSKAHVQVVKVGQTVRIIMNSSCLFKSDSANLKQAYINKIMPMIAKLIHHYEKVNVSVTAYGDYTNDLTRSKALTTRQAQVIASQLWAQNINARLLYAEGEGVKNPIATNSTPKGRFTNRRVEINFRYYVPRVM